MSTKALHIRAVGKASEAIRAFRIDYENQNGFKGSLDNIGNSAIVAGIEVLRKRLRVTKRKGS